MPEGREPARTAKAAQDRYIRILAAPLGCVSRAQWCVTTTIRGNDQDRAIQLTGMGAGQPTRLRRENRPAVFLAAIQSFSLMPDERFATGEWKTRTLAYAYTLMDTQGHDPPDRAIAWHWHPGSGGTDEPHCHVYRAGEVAGIELHKLHLPGERVAFEAVVRFAIKDLGVTPLHADWEARIQSAQERFETFRTWPRSRPRASSSN